MIGPIGDSAEKSAGPVNKMIGSTLRLFGTVKHSIVKIVFTANHLFSPTGKFISSIINMIYIRRIEKNCVYNKFSTFFMIFSSRLDMHIFAG